MKNNLIAERMAAYDQLPSALRTLLSEVMDIPEKNAAALLLAHLNAGVPIEALMQILQKQLEKDGGRVMRKMKN